MAPSLKPLALVAALTLAVAPAAACSRDGNNSSPASSQAPTTVENYEFKQGEVAFDKLHEKMKAANDATKSLHVKEKDYDKSKSGQETKLEKEGDLVLKNGLPEGAHYTVDDGKEKLEVKASNDASWVKRGDTWQEEKLQDSHYILNGYSFVDLLSLRDGKADQRKTVYEGKEEKGHKYTVTSVIANSQSKSDEDTKATMVATLWLDDAYRISKLDVRFKEKEKQPFSLEMEQGDFNKQVDLALPQSTAVTPSLPASQSSPVPAPTAPAKK